MIAKQALVDNWRTKLVRAWSIRLATLSALVQGVFQAWPTAPLDIWSNLPDFIQGVFPLMLVKLMPLFLTVGSMYARIIVQDKLKTNADQ